MAAAAAVGLSPHNGIMFQDYLQKLTYQRGSGGSGSAANSSSFDAAAAAAAAYGSGAAAAGAGTVIPQPYRFNPANTQYTSYPTQVHDPTPAALLPPAPPAPQAPVSTVSTPASSSSASSKFKYEPIELDGQVCAVCPFRCDDVCH